MHITPPSEQDPAVRAFWDEVTRSPPSLLPYEEKAEGPALADALIRERKLVEQGHQVYTKYAGPISIALLVSHLSSRCHTESERPFSIFLSQEVFRPLA